MRFAAAAAFVLSTALAGAAGAQPGPFVRPTHPATQCIDLTGRRHGAVCRKQEASRIDVAPDICICEGGYRTIEVPYCAPGEQPAPDSAAAGRALMKADDRGDIASARFEGRRFCQLLGDGTP